MHNYFEASQKFRKNLLFFGVLFKTPVHTFRHVFLLRIIELSSARHHPTVVTINKNETILTIHVTGTN